VTCQHRAPPTHSPAAADNNEWRSEPRGSFLCKKRVSTTRSFKIADLPIDFIGSTAYLTGNLEPIQPRC